MASLPRPLRTEPAVPSGLPASRSAAGMRRASPARERSPSVASYASTEDSVIYEPTESDLRRWSARTPTGSPTALEPSAAHPAGAARDPAPTRRPGAPPGRTTLVLKCLPVEYTRDMVKDLLDEQSFGGHFDFLHMPCNFKDGNSFGYAFVNLRREGKAQECWHCFEGFSRWAVKSDLVCTVSWANLDGLAANVERFRDSPLMHTRVHDRFKPAIYGIFGERVPFPPPTKHIKPPKTKRL